MIVSVHAFRRRARLEERRLTEWLDDLEPGTRHTALLLARMPSDTQGFRVQKAGPFQHAVVATKNRGH